MLNKGNFIEHDSSFARASTAMSGYPTPKYRTRRQTMTDCKMAKLSSNSTTDLSTSRSSIYLPKPAFPLFKNQY